MSLGCRSCPLVKERTEAIKSLVDFWRFNLFQLASSMTTCKTFYSIWEAESCKKVLEILKYSKISSINFKIRTILIFYISMLKIAKTVNNYNYRAFIYQQSLCFFLILLRKKALFLQQRPLLLSKFCIP